MIQSALMQEIHNSFLGQRFEFKYHLDPIKAAKIESYINSVGLTRDAFSQKPYLVNSLYFDTPTLNDYRDKDGSYLIRKKLRARTYSDSWQQTPENIWLEIKRKRNMHIHKSRVVITPDIWENLINQKGSQTAQYHIDSPEDQSTLDEFMFHYKRELYRPHVIIKYMRTAYMGTFTSPIRITFDRNVVACLVNTVHTSQSMMPITRNLTILEVKFNHKLPWWFTNMVGQFDLQRNDFSKYRNAVATIRGHNLIPINN